MKVLCPRHKESTPSVEVYADGGYCYGCGAQIPMAELEAMGPVPEIIERQATDLEEGNRYIDTLPTKIIRGHDLPYDDLGYYLRFPGTTYYKKRNWDTEPRYLNPTGHKQPLFVARQNFAGRLFVVEGEFNALSIASAYPDDDVVSPGSASNFKKYDAISVLPFRRYYRTIVVVTDNDGPGAEAAIHLKGLLANHVPEVRIVLMPRDANELHIEAGLEGLREEVKRALSEGL